MADSITISIKGLDKLKQQLSGFKTKLEKELSVILDKNAQKVVTRAKQNAPVDEGILRNSISADLSNPLEKHIVVNAPYAAFVEFGTGKYAAEYVGTLPDNWQAFASQFRGQKGSGTFYDLVIIIKEWLKRKGIDVFNREQQYDPESGNVIHKSTRHSKGQREAAYDQAAYFIARKIILDGVHARPYLFPAYASMVPELQQDLKQLFT